MNALELVQKERQRQIELWGDTDNHPVSEFKFTGHRNMRNSLHKLPGAEFAQSIVEINAKHGELTWCDLITEEFAEAMAAASDSQENFVEELIQLAALCVACVDSLEGGQ